MKARVTVTLKNGVLDPQGKAIEGALKSLGVEGIDGVRQGKAIEGALKSLGVDGVDGVRQGKVFDVELGTADKNRAEETLKAACEKLLANTVIENYRIEIA